MQFTGLCTEKMVEDLLQLVCSFNQRGKKLTNKHHTSGYRGVLEVDGC